MPPKGAKGGPAFLTTMTTPYFQKSRRIYISGKLHPSVAVPFRQIEQSPTNHPDGTQSANPPVQVYDTSGPWGDPAITNLDIREGLPALRGSWISGRG
ncbi:MAG: phosphomethylpyrimidine synthase ThiC, partial [Verrucomicrobia bacterium]|nr:phosphomethylpyrimidine synthase ThiC [Verrucomicrobiota bacterium]